MSVPRTISRTHYENGRFGPQSVSLSRVDGGYHVKGHNDPFFYRSPVEAKGAYRSLVAQVSA